MTHRPLNSPITLPLSLPLSYHRLLSGPNGCPQLRCLNTWSLSPESCSWFLLHGAWSLEQFFLLNCF